MLYREKKRTMGTWKWIVRRQRPCAVYRLQLLSLSFILLTSCAVAGSYALPLAPQKPVVSSPLVEISPTISEDQLEQTDSLSISWQMIPFFLLQVEQSRWLRSAQSWLLPNNDYLTLAQVLTIRQDRSPPLSTFVSLVL